MFYMLFIQLYAQYLVCKIFSPHYIARYVKYFTLYLCSFCCSEALGIPTHNYGLATLLLPLTLLT